ncbi:MAG: hypothetical protein ISS14_04815 [Actinobacteria bacterium]|nr:hypothetical protein [Actinomycetota bacterium]MBL7124193.1 hypothetical protein [Actinomycetota bacterium]
MKKTLIIIAIVLTLLIGFLTTSCIKQITPETTEAKSSSGKTIEEELTIFYENYHYITQAYDTENQKLYWDFEGLDNNNDRIKNSQRRIANIKDFRYKLTTLNIPEPLKEFYKIKLQELQVSEDFGKFTISYLNTGNPTIEELIDYQDKVNELSIKSYNLALEIYEKYSLSYLIK